MGGGFHEREAEFGVVLSTTKLLGAPVGAVKKGCIEHSQSRTKYVSAFVSTFICIFILNSIAK